MNKDGFIIPGVFLITLLRLNIIRWVFFKYTQLSKPKYIYWYLFVISWMIAYLPIWKQLAASLL